MSHGFSTGKSETAPPVNIKKVIAASKAGTIAEWYEALIYGVSTIPVVGTLFLPKVDNPLTGIMAAFATYTIDFAARPLGDLIFGHYGNRSGRKNWLPFSLFQVGISTFLMGCIPTFSSIGLHAPFTIIALGFVQGFTLSGEWGGAILLAKYNATIPVTIYLFFVCGIFTVALLCLHEARHLRLNMVDEKYLGKLGASPLLEENC